LTVLRLAADPSYDVAVLEMGMSTPLNEIARLCRITPPDVAIVLNVLPVHVEHLGSIEGVAKAKAELVEGMKVGGTAVLNVDDHRVAAMSELSRGDTITYGIDHTADVTATNIRLSGFGKTKFTLTTPSGSVEVGFPLNGTHNILNALAAAAAGHKFGVAAGEIGSSLSSVAPPQQRGEVIDFPQGFTVINDSYNSNPDALLSMVRTLVEGAGTKDRKIVVAGEMLELGDEAANIHRHTGLAIASMDIDILIGVRGFGRDLVTGAAEAGFEDVRFADSSEMAGEMLADLIRPGDVVLVKGSRGVRTENVIAKLREKYGPEGNDAVAK
jgi:UDP-N-acetylmuramoyl-tripeptide--D-alanyl-D-alanine ligase